MKRGRLPLTALRSFEAAGRHLSFSQAARELFVSQAAISRQVRELENLLGTKLFQRRFRGVDLTVQGRELLSNLTHCFDQIGVALERVNENIRGDVVRLTVDPTIAACWLVPRLQNFQVLHPDIELELIVNPKLMDFGGDRSDIGLHFSYEVKIWQDTIDAIKIADAYETPMISPALLASQGLRTVADLKQFNLLHEETPQHWLEWFKQAGEPYHNRPSGPLLVDPTLTRQAALLGHGIMLGDLFLLHDDLVKNDLVIPFNIFVKVGTYWIAAGEAARQQAAPKAVIEWLQSEADETVSYITAIQSQD